MIKKISDDCCSLFHLTELQLGMCFFNSYVSFNINYASVSLLKHLNFALVFKSHCYLSFRLSLLTVESLTSEHPQMAGGKDREQREENINHAISPSMNKTEQDTTSSLPVVWNRGVLGQALILTVLLKTAQSSSEGSLTGLLKTP